MNAEYVVEIRVSGNDDLDLVELLTAIAAPALQVPRVSVDAIEITKYPEEGPAEHVERQRRVI